MPGTVLSVLYVFARVNNGLINSTNKAAQLCKSEFHRLPRGLIFQSGSPRAFLKLVDALLTCLSP